MHYTHLIWPLVEYEVTLSLWIQFELPGSR